MSDLADFSHLLYKETLDIPAADWLEQNIYFDNNVSPNSPGNLDLSRQPWAKEILDSAMDPRTNELNLVMGAQTGKTTLLMLIWLLKAKFDPSPALIALSTDPLCDRLIKRRLIPLLKCNPWYGDQLPAENRGQESMILFPGAPTFYTGARTADKLASMPASLLLLDEVSKWAKGSVKEAHPLFLVKERVKSFATHLIVAASTPSEEEEIFWTEYLHSSQSHYYMPCPHCGEMIKFEFSEETVQWEKGTLETIRDTACYVCPKCKGKINDSQKEEMMQRGEWRKERENHVPGHLGFHLNSLYSPFVRFGDAAVEFVKANASIMRAEALRNFTNSWLGLPYKVQEKETSAQDILACVDNTRQQCEIPEDTAFVVCGVDCGQDASHYAISAITFDGRINVVDWGTLQSFTSYNGEYGVQKLVEDWEDSSGKWKIDVAYIDSGYSTQQVYLECLNAPYGKLNPIKGSNCQGVWSRRQLTNVSDLDLYLFNDHAIKMTMMSYWRDKTITLPTQATYDKEFIKGLSGQTLIRDKKTGKYSFKSLKADHYHDAVKACVLSSIIEHITPGIVEGEVESEQEG
jgi:phage terminase large subunit GpA-like protein